MMARIKNNVTKIFRARVLVGALLAVLVCVGVWQYQVHEKRKFFTAYIHYGEVAAIQQNATFVPGATANPLRDSLNQTLAKILAKETKPERRLQLAQLGLQQIQDMNAQVDEIGNSSEVVENAAEELSSIASKPGNMLHKKAMQEVAEAAHAQLVIIEDIRGLSYRANFEIIQICNRIIADRGVLDPGYVRELNADLPAVEKEFNTRQSDYTDLQNSMHTIERKAAALMGTK